MAYASIIALRSDDGIHRITLNRPDRLNSFNDAMHAELREALSLVDADNGARVLVLTGAGRGFCAGQDLADRAVATGQAPVDLGVTIGRNYQPLVNTLRSIRVPVIAAVNGVAAGAGANIALACDLVIATESASFIQAFCKIGLIPDSGGTYWLPRLVGTARAMGLAMLGDKLTAKQAAEWGLIWRAVPDAEFVSAVDQLAQQLAEGPTAALVEIRNALHASETNDLKAQLALEGEVQRKLGRSDNYREGVAAFMTKRKPRFSAR